MNEETVGLKLVAQDMASGAIAKVRGELNSLGGVGGIAGKGMGLAERAVGSLAGAANHLKGTIGGLISGPLGFLGLTAGALGVFGALKSGIDTASNMALALEKLTRMTGEDAQAMSGLLAVTGKFGVSSDQLSTIVGFEEKTTGKLAQTYVKTAAAGKSAALQSLELQKAHLQEAGASTKVIDKLITEQKARDLVNASMAHALPSVNKLQALQKQYGVTLTDSKGQALDFSTVLNNVSDYYDSNATAGQKAALASTLFGRGYAVMIPVLQLGAAGFAKAQQAAEALGLTVNDQNAGDLMKYQENMRNLGDAVGGLQLQLSLALVPALNTVATALTQFVGANRDKIVGFFQGLLQWSREAAGVIINTVIPGLEQLAKVASDAWNTIPAPLRNMIVTGLVADRTMKFLFGFDPVTTVGKLIGGQILGVLASGLGLAATKAGLGGVAGALTERGSPTNPMWVKVLGGLPGGGSAPPVVGPAEDVAAGGSAGFMADLVAGLGPLAIAAAVPLILNALINGDPTKTGLDDLKARQQIAAARGLDPTKVATPDQMAFGRRSSALPPGMPMSAYGAYTGTADHDTMTSIKEAMAPAAHGLANILPLITSINKFAMIEQHRLEAHAAAKKAVGGHGDPFHQFLMQLRSGSASMAVKLGAKELAYLSTASQAQIDSVVGQRGIREDIAAEKRALVTASGDQKKVISADILGLQHLLKDQKPPIVNVSVGISKNSVTGTVLYQNVYGHSHRQD